jgi:TonB-dependent receptor
MKFTFKHLLLGTAALGACATSSALMAQDTGAGNGVTEVVVSKRRPLAESQIAALQAQKTSDSLVSVVSADDVGDLPDQNVAQALSRVPGIGIERDQGQGRYVNLRGSPRYWTTLSFDGLSVVSPEGRQTRFDNIPSSLVSRLTVQKALVPSMSGDTVAGNVDIRTRRAFDYKGQKITGKLGLGQVELGDGEELDSGIVYSNIFMDGKLGVVAQASFYRRDMATENWETDPYLTNSVAPSKRFASETKNKHYRLIRENTAYSLRADYKFNANHSLFISSINTEYHDNENRDQFIFQLSNATDSAGNGYTTSAFINGNDPVRGTAFGARISGRITYRDYVDAMTTNTLGGEHHFDNGLKADWRLNYTWTDNTSDTVGEARFATNNSSSAFAARPTVVYDFTDRTSNIATLYATGGTSSARTRGAATPNIETFLLPISQLTAFDDSEITEAYTAKVDFDKDMDVFGLSHKVEFGGLWVTREKSKKTYSRSASTTGMTTTYADLAQDGPYLGEQRLGYTFRYSNVSKVLGLVNTHLGLAARTFNEGDYYNVRETVGAAYVMATTDYDWGNLVYGIRAETIENKGQAYASINGGAATLTTVSSEETLAYPSLNANWNISQTLKARFGLTTSASRADFDDYRPNLVINDADTTISGGNPFIKPEKQIGLDAYLEYYPKDGGFASVGLFHKDLSDVLFRKLTIFGSTALNTNSIDRSNYRFTTQTNGGDGEILGLELAYYSTFKNVAQKLGLPSWTEGFGINTSATFTETFVKIPAIINPITNLVTEPARTTNLSGASDSLYNLQFFYEKNGLTLKLAAQYRTPWLQDLGSYSLSGGQIVPNGNGDIYWDDDMEVDFSARYQLTKQVELYFDAANLTNDGSARYGDTAAFPTEYERFGKRMIAGVRFNF